MEELQSELRAWLRARADERAQAMRFGFSLGVINVGDRCLVYFPDGAVYFCVKTSQNYYQSGNLTIPVDSEGSTACRIKEYPPVERTQQ